MTDTYMDRLEAVKDLLSDPAAVQQYHDQGQRWLSANMMSGLTTGEPLSLLVSSLLMSLRAAPVEEVLAGKLTTLAVCSEKVYINGVCVAHPQGLIRGEVPLARAVLLHEAMHLILMHNIRATETYEMLRSQGYVSAPGRINKDTFAGITNLVLDVVDDAMSAEASRTLKNTSHAMLTEHHEYCRDQLIAFIDKHCTAVDAHALSADIAAQRLSTTDAIVRIVKAIPFNQEAADAAEQALKWVEQHVQLLEDTSPGAIEGAKTLQAARVATAGRQAGAGHALADLCISALEYLKPAKVSWQDQLEASLGNLSEDLGYARQAQNDMYRGIVLPDYVPGHGAIAIAFDTSGSVWCDPVLRSQLLTEMSAILSVLPFERIYFLPCDSKVHECVELMPGDPMPDKKFVGGGGTSFNGPFNYIEEHDLPIDAMVYMTDGYGQVTVMEPDYPTVWLLGDNSTDQHLPFGNVISVAN